MPKAILIREYGDSSVLRLEDIDVAPPDEDELRIKQTAIGVHYHDIYVRTGLYKTLSLPGIPGVEATGTVEAVGSKVTDFRSGDRIGYITSGYGAYASHRLLKAKLAIKLPDFISDEMVATNFTRALTVQMLVKNVAKLKSSQSILITAASGGVGRLLCQYANSLGVFVIGSVSTPEKGSLAKSYGANHSLIYDQKDFVSQVMDLTQGKGVDIAYDSVGATTFSTSLKALSKCGHLINFGQSSGPVEPLYMPTLAEKSLTVSRPIIFHYICNPKIYREMAESVFETFKSHNLILPKTEPYTLENVSKAHRVLESRQGGGSLFLRP